MNIVLYLYRAKIFWDIIIYFCFISVDGTAKTQTTNYITHCTLGNVKNYSYMDEFYKRVLVQQGSEKFYRCLDFTTFTWSLVIMLLLLCIYQLLLFLTPWIFIVKSRNKLLINKCVPIVINETHLTAYLYLYLTPIFYHMFETFTWDW